MNRQARRMTKNGTPVTWRVDAARRCCGAPSEVARPGSNRRVTSIAGKSGLLLASASAETPLANAAASCCAQSEVRRGRLGAGRGAARGAVSCLRRRAKAREQQHSARRGDLVAAGAPVVPQVFDQQVAAAEVR